jgi:hypothetical protein
MLGKNIEHFQRISHLYLVTVPLKPLMFEEWTVSYTKIAVPGIHA